MRIHIEISLGNDACRGEGDLAGILEEYAKKLRRGEADFFDEDANPERGIFHDANGNTVGGWKLSDGPTLRLELKVGRETPVGIRASLEGLGRLVAGSSDIDSLMQRPGRPIVEGGERIGYWRVTDE